MPETRLDPKLDLDTARATLDSQPFSRLLGARITAFGDGSAVLEVPVRDDLRQQNGFLHGGVLGYAADNAITSRPAPSSARRCSPAG
jgi:acyl-coenzyme A thioesterase PaaI-like protein